MFRLWNYGYILLPFRPGLNATSGKLCFATIPSPSILENRESIWETCRHCFNTGALYKIHPAGICGFGNDGNSIARFYPVYPAAVPFGRVPPVNNAIFSRFRACMDIPGQGSVLISKVDPLSIVSLDSNLEPCARPLICTVLFGIAAPSLIVTTN